MLWREEVWFVIACTRSCIVNTIEIGMCAFVRDIMREHFFNPRTRDFRSAGISLCLNEDQDPTVITHVFFKHTITIADFKALKEVMHSMGHAGLKPCPVCRNVVVPSLANGIDLFSYKELDLAKWDMHIDASVKSMLEFLRYAKARLGNVGNSKNCSREMGYHYNGNHVALDTNLQYASISTLCYDWPHVWCVKGIMQLEICGFIDFVREHTPTHMKGVTLYEDLHAHMQKYTWSKRQKACQSLFETGKLACVGVDLLRASPAIRHFCREVVQKEPALQLLHAAAEVVALGCDVLEMLTCASRNQVTPKELHNASMKYLRAHKDVHKDTLWVFKHHMAASLVSLRIHLSGRENTETPNAIRCTASLGSRMRRG